MQDQLADLDRVIKDSRVLIDVGQAVERLKESKDFRTIISVGYFEKEAIRLVHLKSDPNMQTPERQASIESSMLAIGNLAHYLDGLLREAEIAKKQLQSAEEYREDLLADE